MASRRTAAKKPAQPDPTPEEQAPELHGVFVQRVEDPEQGTGYYAVPHGDVRPTEIETILKLGLKSFRQATGLEE